MDKVSWPLLEDVEHFLRDQEPSKADCGYCQLSKERPSLVSDAPRSSGEISRDATKGSQGPDTASGRCGAQEERLIFAGF
jgi:hypothetical protein